MSDNRPRRLSRDTTERLLRGEGDPAHQALAGLLASASAHPGGGEQPGEDSALAAFREALSGPVTTPRRKSMLRATLAKALTAKVALTLAATTACGGVAVTAAAATGNLPDPVNKVLGIKKHLPKPPAVPTPALSTPAIHTPSTPSLVALCKSYIDASAHGGGEGALHTKQFSGLVQAAGGDDSSHVTAYCEKLIHSVPTSAPSGVPQPSTPGAPGTSPSGLPHLPSSLPTTVPTWRPSFPPHPTPSLPIHVKGH